MTPSFPTVSVVMAVKNGGQIMREAIDSILNQTFTDFEFIIINDGSTDETLEVLSEYTDSRIQVYSQENRGVAISANRGLALARGRYIARQDHDDISLPERLEKQVAFMEANPKVGLLGTAAEIWVGNEPSSRYHDHPISNAELKFELIFDNPFVNTSTIFRKSIIRDIGLYNPSPQITPLDDFDFISRVSHKYGVANLAERLVIYREFNRSLTSAFRTGANVKQDSLKSKLAKITSMNIANLLDLKLENKYCLAWGRLVSMQKFNTNNIKFADMSNLLIKASEKLGFKSDGLVVNQLFAIKLDHLQYLWYVNPGVADWHHKKLFFGKKWFQKKSKKIIEIFMSIKVRIQERTRIRLSKIKQWFLRALR